MGLKNHSWWILVTRFETSIIFSGQHYVEFIEKSFSTIGGELFVEVPVGTIANVDGFDIF